MTVRLKALFVIGIALFASSCGSAGQSIEAQATTTQVPTSRPHEDLGSQAPLEQWGLSYRCEDGYPTGQSSRVFRADELSRAFSSPASQAQFDQVFANSQVPIEAGEPGDWHYLGDGLLIHSQPLTQDGTAFIIATSLADDPYESLSQCRLVRATGEERPVDSPFWTSEELSEPGSPTLEVRVPACVAEQTLDTDAVIFENQLVVTLNDETGCGREPSTDVQTISIEVEASETALRIVDGSLWPFQPPGSRPQGASVELGQSSPSCTYQFAYPQVTVSWEGVPASTSGQIFLVNPPIEGSTFTVEGLEGQSPIRFAFESRLSVMFGDVEADEAPDFVIGTGVRSTPGEDVNENTTAEIRLSKNGEALTIQCQQLTPTAWSCSAILIGGSPALQVVDQNGEQGAPIGVAYRDGVQIELVGFDAIDPGAEPGGTYQYSFDYGFDGDPTGLLDCGEIQVPEPTSGIAQIEQAKEIYDRVSLAPFDYLTFELICEGCLEGSLHAVGEKTSPGGASNWQISSGGTEIPSSDIPLAIFPDTVHQALIDAINSGSNVQFKIDRASGLPVEWTIDGIGMRYTCFNADTLPPGLADGRGCVAEFNTIGSTD